jgi:DMSO/TMAO reductase YedYZ molybdopterin-dependent catalytic subunit
MTAQYRGALVWGIGAALWVAGLVAVAPVAGAFLLSPPISAVVALSPGWLATAVIERLGAAAQPLLAAVLALAFVGAAAAAGYLREQRREGPGLRSLGFWGPAAAGIGLYWLSPVPFEIPGVVAAAATGAPPYLFAYATRRAVRRGTDYARRGMLRRTAAGAAAVGVLGGLSAAGERVGVDVGAARSDDPLPERLKRGTGRTIGSPNTGNDTAVETEGEFGFGFGGMPARVERIEAHYVVDINPQNPTIDSADWELAVGGAVEEPYALSLDDLIEHPDTVSLPITMVCISNPVGGDLISTTTWHAVPLEALVDEAGVREAAVDVVTKAVDGYSEAIPLETAREMDAFVAFGADGATLTPSHGFPARLLLPGRYGMKSTKWLTEIELATEEHDAYWESRGWDEEAVINTLAYARGAARTEGEVAVGGVAYAGVRGIQKVEVSRDGGDTWQEAELEDPPSEHAWRRWRHIFPAPDTEKVEVVVRAVDGTGSRQTREESNPHPGGSTGWHRRTFFVE